MYAYRASDYTINKLSQGIVYRFANEIIEIRESDFLQDNPGKTTADFEILKNLSDEIYHEQEKQDYRQTWKNTSLHILDDTEDCATPSPEDDIIFRLEGEQEKIKKTKLGKWVWNQLTDTQRKRYLLYYIDGMTLREIAEIDNVCINAVFECLQGAERKIKKILANS